MEIVRRDHGDRAAVAGVVEMLAALQYLLVSAGASAGLNGGEF